MNKQGWNKQASLMNNKKLAAPTLYTLRSGEVTSNVRALFACSGQRPSSRYLQGEWELKGLTQTCPLSKSRFTLEVLRAAYLSCCSQHPPGVWSVKLFWRNFGQPESSVSTEKHRSFLMLVIHHSLTLPRQALQHVQGKQRFSDACKESLTLGVACLVQPSKQQMY